MATSEVALYKYENNGWEKKPKIKGTIFLYEKKCKLCFGFLILNPSKATSEILSITKETEIDDLCLTLDEGEPILFYKNEVIY